MFRGPDTRVGRAPAGRRGDVGGQSWDRHGRGDRHGGADVEANKGAKGDELPEMSLSTEDAAFLQAAGSIALEEVVQGATVLERSQDPAVLELATDTVRDHWRQLVKQVRLHEALGLPFPTLTPEQIAAIGALQATPDDQLDATYVANQIGGHESALALFRDAADATESKIVRWFTATLIPKLEQHLAAAQAIAGTPAPAEPAPAA